MNQNELYHHGILGQKWGVRRYQNYDGTLKTAGRKRYSGETLFVSGSSKTQDPESEWYLKKLPRPVRKDLRKSIRKGDTIIVGDAPGIDRQVQDFLNKKRYDRVEVYGPGKQVRYSANSKWKTNPIDDPDHPEGSKEWLAKKDIAMNKAATKGLAVTIEGGSSATWKNVNRFLDDRKNIKVYELSNTSIVGRNPGKSIPARIGQDYDWRFHEVKKPTDVSWTLSKGVYDRTKLNTRALEAIYKPNKR